MKWSLLPLLITSLPLCAITREEAADFLFGTLSLPDKTDYSEQFYLDNIDLSLRAREEMPWGKIVPDKEFLHFVLPVRVNNENLDDARAIFYEELKDRVKNLSMEEAILEVNHWCHEKVTYQPSDGRTSSPLSTLSQAIGRCGEESTFTVAALRSVGIPARQIYTPRWAHTDDNHAWVEAWADGKWHFIGACEPEPVLDLAWFNAPASRGLLMSTNVAGIYPGPEEILLDQSLVTRINVTENYAPISTLPVEVVYADGSPVPGAIVNFCIYNYAEYFPAVTKTADPNGKTSLNAGLGDIVVWATDGTKFGFAKGNSKDFAQDNSAPLKVTLDKDETYAGAFELDIIPPPARANLPSVSAAQRSLNDNLLAREDSIRKAYTSNFSTRQQAVALADQMGVDVDKLSQILTESRGNHKMIVETLNVSEPALRPIIIDLLASVSEKDRRDITSAALLDHAVNAHPFAKANIPNSLSDNDKINAYNLWVLSPRIEIEYIRPWRKLLKEGFGDEILDMFRKNPEALATWIDENITIVSDENPQNLRMSPLAVWNSRKTDNRSRDIFYVAAARTAGIPARINPVTSTLEYLGKNAEWTAVKFKADKDNSRDNTQISPKGWLTVTFEPQGHMVDPKYYSQFSISKINDGIPSLLEFDENLTISQIFEKPYALDPGSYILTSGSRLADGGVLARSEIFTIAESDTVTLPLTIRFDDSKLSVIGSLNAENIYYDLASNTDKSLLSTTGRGYYVLGLLSPNHEPSEHALNDISVVNDAFEKDGRKIMLLFADADKAYRFDESRFPALPSNVVFGIDNNGLSRNEIIESLHLTDATEPIFVVADSFNRIVWISTGYTIGLGEQLLSILSRLE